MNRTNLLTWSVILMALPLFLQVFIGPAHAQVGAEQAAADRAAIVGHPFTELKEALERSFPREEALEQWVTTMAAQHPSVWYILIVNSENKFVCTWFRPDAKPQAPALQAAFRGINKFTMTEGVVDHQAGGQRVLVSREKLVIEMDTYYFEFGLGPIQ